MHTVELLECAVRYAGQIGFRIRREWLGGRTGGDCEFGGRRWLFIDESLTTREQLGQVMDALLRHPDVDRLPKPRPLQKLLAAGRRAA